MFQAPAILDRVVEMHRVEEYCGNYPQYMLLKGSKLRQEAAVVRVVELDATWPTSKEVTLDNQKYKLFQQVLKLFWDKIADAEKAALQSEAWQVCGDEVVLGE
ncbi:hypothetical protein CYMTET_5249 [Cymbomonas tetramitiformis]|uniref:Uncharacterized protein n=1 Tax=Cymbomonas tetramitiformis TaxID=36881 RepID=A0AAE0GZU1_9CHLO|nr:hypothetical protein CYMTET_5249 [Cymbomonas tetramitiformis]